MGVEVQISPNAVDITLTGWDRAMNWRRSVAVELSAVSGARVEQRSALECLIGHRASGCGTHNGGKRPNRRRVGTMLGREVPGKQFWAVPASEDSTRLLVLDMQEGHFKRFVLAVEDPEAVSTAIHQSSDTT